MLPRLLVLIGSGELAPQMTRGYRSIARQLVTGNAKVGDVRAAIIDTPYGFQSNADALSETLVDHFDRRVGLDAGVASLRRADIDPVAREAAYERIRQSSFVFSGPGSPSYAVRTWAQSEVPSLFADKLEHGGALVLASAAALAIGRLTAPVYEIYKVGQEPHWLPGLDVLRVVGLSAAVVPHWDNAEGPGHDTRYAFLGEQRLLEMERQMPDDVFILGIDEHTALMVDLDAGTASVVGRGEVTVRRKGVEAAFPSGTEIPLANLAPATQPAVAAGVAAERKGDEPMPLARRLLDLEEQVGTLSGRAALAEGLVEALLELRATARASGDYATADAIRERLTALGVSVTDSAGGSATEFTLPDC